jgi:anti-sigma-K factor RskA
MNVPHEQYQHDLAAFALGSLEPEETARLERHLAECASCRELLAEYEEVMRLLPLGLPRAEPSPVARRELFHRLRVDRAEEADRRRSDWWHRFRLQALTVAASVLVVLAGAIIWGLYRDDEPQDAAAIVDELQEQPDTRIVAMRGSEAAPQAVGQLLFQPGDTKAGLVVSGLPPQPDDRAYQLWFVRPDETRIDGGVFRVDDDGRAIVVVSAPADYAVGWSCGVTDEPAGGSDQPTGRNVLRGTYKEDDW